MKLSYRIESFNDLRTLDVCLDVIICGDHMMYHVPHDVSFGDQLAGFMTLGTYA